MPELPEVETVVRTLEKQLGQCQIVSVEVRYPRIIDTNLEEFLKEIPGKTIKEYSRRGKYLHFIFADNTHLYVHLRMEGKFYIVNELNEVEQKHVHVVFKLSDGRYLLFNDVRKFGRMYYSKDGKLKEVDKLGIEPFDEKLTVAYLKPLVKKSKEDLKSFLLNQENITGIGNIYANEICFMLKKHPEVKVASLKDEDLQLLIDSTKDILSKAIAAGGTTIRSYTSSLNVTGRFQLQVLVHGKENEECCICHTKIVKYQLHGRGTYYCPNCQK